MHIYITPWLTGFMNVCATAFPGFLSVRQLGVCLLPVYGMCISITGTVTKCTFVLVINVIKPKIWKKTYQMCKFWFCNTKVLTSHLLLRLLASWKCPWKAQGTLQKFTFLGLKTNTLQLPKLWPTEKLVSLKAKSKLERTAPRKLFLVGGRAAKFSKLLH